MKPQLTEKQKKNLIRISEVVDEGNLAVVKHISDIEDELDTKIRLLEIKVDTFIKNVEKNTSEALIVAQNTAKMRGDDGYTPQKGIDYNDGENYVLTESDKVEIASKIKVPIVKKEIIIEKVEVIREQPIIKTEIVKEIVEKALSIDGAEVVDKINNLPLEDDFQIGVEHIKGLEELLKRAKGRNIYIGGNQSGGRIVKSYDITSQLNGVLKTFALPAVWRVISVHASSFPWTFRETADYTWTPTSITFTSEITAAATLATGQTITVVYSEP